MKHTPGNWKYHHAKIITDYDEGPAKEYIMPRTWGHGCDRFFIADLNDDEYHQYQDESEQIANGYLLAAAPDLLAAIELGMPENNWDGPTMLQSAAQYLRERGFSFLAENLDHKAMIEKLAIKKAKGE